MFMFLQTFFMVGYFCKNGNVFPPPLSLEEEKKYLENLKKGDEDSKRILIERNLRLVAHVAKKYSVFGFDEDIISIGTIGLIKGILSFDNNKNVRLATYAAKCIENEILMHLRASKKYKKDTSLQDPVGCDKEGNEITMLDILSTDDMALEDLIDTEIQISKLFKEFGSVLKEREKEVLIYRYGLFMQDELTQKKIAKKMGISRSYVSRIEKKALEKLRKEFEKKS